MRGVSMRRSFIAVCFTAAFLVLSNQAISDLIVWNIDSNQSFIRLNFSTAQAPVNVNIGGDTVISTSFTAVDSDSAVNWTDSGGRRAAIAGTISTDWNESSGLLTFLSGLHDMSAVDSGVFRPNPAAFSGGVFTNDSSSPAAFGAKVRGVGAGVTGGFVPLPIFLDSDLMYFALRNVFYDAGGSAALSNTGGGFVGNGGEFGILSAGLDVSTLEYGVLIQVGDQLIPTELLPAIAPSELNTNFNQSLIGNTGALSIFNLGGLDRQLTKIINSELQLVVGGVIFSGTLEGQIVAFGQVVPEPTSAALLFTALFLVGSGRCRAHRES
jgi:hypothetical protein